MAVGKNDVEAIGYLSFLNLSEEDAVLRHDAEKSAYVYLEEQGVLESVENGTSLQKDMIPYDSLDAMLMGLISGEVNAIDVPDCTAKYLSAVNDQVKQVVLYHPEKAEGFSQELIDKLGNGYSFMMLEENSDLRDQFNQAIAGMKEDGTLEELVRVHITDVAESGEPAAVAFEQFDGEPIRVAVTGSLPPMDYVAVDGSFAGFNTAILSEIGKRLEKNIELVQVDSVGRALALAQGSVDAVFWTRGMAGDGRGEGDIPMRGEGIMPMSDEEAEANRQEFDTSHTEEEIAVMDGLMGSLPFENYDQRDRPEGTITTSPYYSDINVAVTLK